jgi:hypothetical protein
VRIAYDSNFRWVVHFVFGTYNLYPELLKSVFPIQ